MKRIRKGIGAWAVVAMLTLSMAAAAPAQAPQPNPALLTEVQTAGIKRVKEMIEVLNSGDHEKIRAYFKGQGHPNGTRNAIDKYRRASATTSFAWSSCPIAATSSPESSATELPEMSSTSRSG